MARFAPLIPRVSKWRRGVIGRPLFLILCALIHHVATCTSATRSERDNGNFWCLLSCTRVLTMLSVLILVHQHLGCRNEKVRPTRSSPSARVENRGRRTYHAKKCVSCSSHGDSSTEILHGITRGIHKAGLFSHRSRAVEHSGGALHVAEYPRLEALDLVGERRHIRRAAH